jgi:DNA-binding beta-propeller fold protein YncE
MRRMNKLLWLFYTGAILMSCRLNNEVISGIPTASPSVMSSGSPVINVSSTPLIPDYSGYEKYCSGVYCKPIDENNLKAKLDNPVDVAVSSDGKTVYVTNSSKQTNGDCGTERLIDRKFIYKITEDKKISIIKTQEGYPSSCTLSQQIETDKDNNIYVSAPVIYTQAGAHGFPVIGQKIIRITNENNSSIIGDIDFSPIDLSPTASPGSTNLANLFVSKEDNSVYFTLLGGAESYRQTLNKLISKTEIEELYIKTSFGGSIPSFVSKNDSLYFEPYFISPPYPVTNTQHERFISIIKFDDRKMAAIVIKMNSKGEIIGTPYLENKISKVIPGDKRYYIAGSGKAGYKDGKGEQAEFNNPVGLDIDAEDNIYVADTGNNAIRKITPDGTVTTFYKEGN